MGRPSVSQVVAVALVIVVVALALEATGGGTHSATKLTRAPLPAPGRGPDYGETLLKLPGFNPLYGYTFGENCPGRCSSNGSTDSQVPVLSNDEVKPQGIYFIDNYSDLVLYSFAEGYPWTLAHVTLLYQLYAAYGGMLQNEFTLEYGYADALLFGTVNPRDTSVSVETVNLTSGAVRMAGNVAPADPYNQQALYIGNDTVLIFSQIVSGAQPYECPGDCRATVEGVNLRTGQTWPAASLPFFEANNIYWLPQKHQLINVEAHGATGDQVEQWNESVNATGEPTFFLAADPSFDQSATINWVNGIAYNASSDKIAFSAGSEKVQRTYVLGYGADGRLTAQGETTYPTVLSIQRYVFTSDYILGEYSNGTQYLFDPWNGSMITTNEPFTDLSPDFVCDGPGYLGESGTGLGWVIDFHATVTRTTPFWSVVLATAS